MLMLPVCLPMIKLNSTKSFAVQESVYHLQLLHTELLATLEGDALLPGILQGVVPHRGAQADDHIHPGGQRQLICSLIPYIVNTI